AVLGTAALYGGLGALGLAAVYGVGTGIAVEHRARAALAAQRPAAPAPEQAGQVGVETLTAALVHAGVLREGQLVGLAGPVVQVPGGWRAEIILPPGYTVAMVRARIDRLASALSTTPAYLSIVDGATAANF